MTHEAVFVLGSLSPSDFHHLSFPLLCPQHSVFVFLIYRPRIGSCSPIASKWMEPVCICMCRNFAESRPEAFWFFDASIPMTGGRSHSVATNLRNFDELIFRMFWISDHQYLMNLCAWDLVTHRSLWTFFVALQLTMQISTLNPQAYSTTLLCTSKQKKTKIGIPGSSRASVSTWI